METITLFLLVLLVFIISALPLYIAIKLLGGKGSILRVILVNIIVAIVAFAIKFFFDSWGGVIAFILMIWIYKDFFRLGWISAIFAWALQFVVALLLVLLLGALGLGIAIF